MKKRDIVIIILTLVGALLIGIVVGEAQGYYPAECISNYDGLRTIYPVLENVSCAGS